MVKGQGTLQFLESLFNLSIRIPPAPAQLADSIFVCSVHLSSCENEKCLYLVDLIPFSLLTKTCTLCILIFILPFNIVNTSLQKKHYQLKNM